MEQQVKMRVGARRMARSGAAQTVVGTQVGAR